jgi:hypothetical protein
VPATDHEYVVHGRGILGGSRVRAAAASNSRRAERRKRRLAARSEPQASGVNAVAAGA